MNTDLDLSIIVAMTPGRVIGNKGKLPWKKLPSDMARFKEITMDAGVVIMGYTTYMSILERNKKPLSERKHIVLTRKRIRFHPEMVHFVDCVEDALVETIVLGGRACVIGGEQIYKLFLPLPEVKRAFVTTVNAELRGDAFFPSLFDRKANNEAKMGWRIVSRSLPCRLDRGDEYETSLEMYEHYRYVERQ